jgi:hypothetical protein
MSIFSLLELLKSANNGSVRHSFWLCGGLSIFCMIVWIVVEACFNQHKLEQHRTEGSQEKISLEERDESNKSTKCDI